jgi:hypothetical protein
MKVTDFKIGVKYCLPDWREGYFLEAKRPTDFRKRSDGVVIMKDSNRIYFVFSLDEQTSDDWQEYKEHVDYGTYNNRKLMLVRNKIMDSYFWLEGWQSTHTDNFVSLIVGDILHYLELPKSDIFKVIALPSKDL